MADGPKVKKVPALAKRQQAMTDKVAALKAELAGKGAAGGSGGGNNNNNNNNNSSSLGGGNNGMAAPAGLAGTLGNSSGGTAGLASTGGAGGIGVGGTVSGVLRPSKRLGTPEGGALEPEVVGESEAKLRAQIKTLKADLERRQASYVERERELKTRIQVLQQERDKLKADHPQHTDAREKLDILREMHTDILSNIEHVQDQTSRVLAEQERDLLRAFRARLFDVQTELEQQKAKAVDGASVWIEKTRQLEKELDWAKEMADRLDRHNQSYIRENARLKTQFKTQEDDREYLIRQLVAAKKDNARLRQELARVKSDLAETQRAAGENAALDGPLSPGVRPTTPQGSSATARIQPGKIRPPNPVEENRYKDIIRRLKKLLEQERKSLRQTRSQLAGELQSRTELQMFLHQCIEDVKADIMRRRSQLTGGGYAQVALGSSGGKTAEVPLSEFEAADRERVMELLLSQERVISLLYSRTFPPNPALEAPSPEGRPESAGQSGGAMDLSASLEALQMDDDVGGDADM